MSAHDNDSSNNCNTSNNNANAMTQVDAVVEGKLILPPNTSARRVTKPKKEYPPGSPGKVLIFRWTRTDERTGQIIRAHGRPFPMGVDP